MSTDASRVTNKGLRLILESSPDAGPLLFKLGAVALKQIGDEYVYVDVAPDRQSDSTDNETVMRLSEAFREL
jgi:hypothetical protein